MNKKKQQNRYIQGLGVLIIVLALGRCVFSGFSDGSLSDGDEAGESMVEELDDTEGASRLATENVHGSMTYRPDGVRPHRLGFMSDYREEFPDSNELQLSAASRWGVSPVANRRDAEYRRDQLVYICASPYYRVDPLTASIPYLVPRAAILLQDMGRAFFDSLQVKGFPLHRFIVTSVLRTEEDVVKLRRYNKNATERSCHLYGTTVDITYTRFDPVNVGGQHGSVSEGQLKCVLAEVLRDMRRQERCYIKYEVKQSCFHLTVR